MTDRYDVAVSEEGQDGKRRWQNIGVMFPSKKGEGFNIKLAGPHGVSWLSVFPAKPKDDRQGSRPAARDDADSIPFAPEVR
jgi:hypothetical protein